MRLRFEPYCCDASKWKPQKFLSDRSIEVLASVFFVDATTGIVDVLRTLPVLLEGCTQDDCTKVLGYFVPGSHEACPERSDP